MSNIFDVIKQRHSIGKMTEQRPTHEQIERMLEAATHAPNHHKVEPWKFFVLAGKARNELGEIMARSLAERQTDKTSAIVEALLEKERKKPLRSPVLIVVASEKPQNSKVVDVENVAATAAAVENMLLTAQEIGLACMWRTGDAAYDPRVKQWLGLTNEEHIVAILYIGYAAIEPTERHPQTVESKTTWLGWSD